MKATEDHILVALIGHTLQAETVAKKRAARLLLDTLRNGNSLDGLHDQLEGIEPVQAGMVVKELNGLIHRYGLAADG